jgi:Ca2+-binding RTX toxin-like protein
VLTGSANIRGGGNALNNRITGNSGFNYIVGGAGYDTLRGGGGTDEFQFYYPYSRPDVDRLPDFNVAERIAFAERWPGISSPPEPGARPLSSSEFHVGAFATTASQRILYDPGPIVFAILPTGLALTAGNFRVYSTSI